jgi:hypothetical protein
VYKRQILIDDRNKFLKSSFAELSRLEGAFIQSSRKARDARIKAELEFNKAINTNTVSGPETDASVQARFLKRIENVLSPKGITDLKGLSTDVQTRGGGVAGIGSKLKDVTKQLAESQRNLADAEKRGEGKDKKAIEENKKLTSQFVALRNALQEYTNVQSRLAVINEDLARSQEKTKSLRELAINASFGTSEQKNEAQRLINAVAVANSEGIQRVAPELQRQVIGLLPQLMGQKGEDQVNSELSAMFKSFGLSADGIVNASKDTIANAKRRDEVLREAADALSQLAQNDKQRADIMATAIEKQNNKFLEKLENLFIEEQKRTVGLDFKVQDRLNTSLQESSRIVDEKNITNEQFQAIKNQNQAIDEFKNASDKLQGLLKFEGKLGVSVDQLYRGGFTKQVEQILGTAPADAPGAWMGEYADFPQRTGIDFTKSMNEQTFLQTLEQLFLGPDFARNIATQRPLTDKSADSDKILKLIKATKAIAEAKFETGALTKFTQSTEGIEDGLAIESVSKLLTAFDQGIVDSRVALKKIAEQSPAIASAANIAKSIRDRLETEFKDFANLEGFLSGVSSSARELEVLRTKLEILNGSPVFTQAEKEQNAAAIKKESTAIAENKIRDKKARDVREQKAEDAKTLPERREKRTAALINLLEQERGSPYEAEPRTRSNNYGMDAVLPQTSQMRPPGRLGIIMAEEEAKKKTPVAAPVSAPKTDGDGTMSFQEKFEEYKNRERTNPALRTIKATTDAAMKQKDEAIEKIAPKPGETTTRTLIGGEVQPPPSGSSGTNNRRLQIKEIENLKNLQTRGIWSGLQKGVLGISQRAKEIRASNALRSGALGEGEAAQERLKMLTDDNPANDREALEGLLPSPKGAEAANKAQVEMNKSAQNGESLSVHDHHAVPLLSEILMVLKGEGGGGEVSSGAAFSIDTAGLNSSVEKFSKSIGELEKVMGSPLSIQVGGEINLNVNLNGAEFLRDAKDSFAQLAGQKITQGINNFIRDGLKNSGIGISSNWVGDESSNQRMGSNSSSGNTA